MDAEAVAVAPAGALDAEAWTRGVTVSLPDGRVTLHPTALSEGRAGLLPGQDTPVLLWSIDSAAPRGVAVLTQALQTFRGAGYETFTRPPATTPVHAALAAPYAHVTAPLRRLVDRYAGQIALDVAQDRPVTDWALAGLEELPGVMTKATQRIAAIDRRCSTSSRQ